MNLKDLVGLRRTYDGRTGKLCVALECAPVNVYVVADPRLGAKRYSISVNGWGTWRIALTTNGDTKVLTYDDGSHLEAHNTGLAVAGPGGHANSGIHVPPSHKGSLRVSNTGAAVAGAGGTANSGIIRSSGGNFGSSARLGDNASYELPPEDGQWLQQVGGIRPTVTIHLGQEIMFTYV